MGRRDRQKGKAAAEAGKSDMNKFYLVLGAVAVIAIGGVAYSAGSRALSQAVTEPIEVEGLDDPATLLQLAQGMTLGDPDAPITVIEFADYQCPACQVFFSTEKPQIELGLIQSGRAKLLFYDFPLVRLHPHAFFAARAARCGGDQGRFWEYHDALFQNQGSWSSSANPANQFEAYAANLGLDKGAFGSCLHSDRFADVVTANMRLGQELGVPGTPTIMVSKGGGMATRIPSATFREVATVVERLMAEGGQE